MDPVGAAAPEREGLIEKRDDNHREAKLESFTTAIYLHSHEDVVRRDHPGDAGTEKTMRLSRSIHVEAALACGFVLTALVLGASNSAAEAGSGTAVSRHLSLQHKSVDPRAIAQVPPTPTLFSLPSFGSYVPAPRKPETDGLSRNPNDCVKYGCIDN
jgi:hypothetical protein